MASFIELSRKAEELIHQSAKLVNSLGFPTSAETIQENLNAFKERKLTVVVAGEARRGKSSMLNALLNEKEYIFPVDVNVCTNVVTIVQYGETEEITLYLEDASTQGFKTERIPRQRIADYVSEKGNPNNYKKVKMLKASIPNELLKEGIVFVDTPGVGSLNIEHAETTYSFLPNADLLLFVTDADSGMTQSELEFLKRGYGYCKNILFPLTKMDLNANYMTIAEDNRKKIAAALQLDEETVEVVPVSSMAKLRYLERGNESLYINSNYKALESSIWTSIATHKNDVLLTPFVTAVRQELVSVTESLAAQYQTLGKEVSGDLVEQLNRQINELEQLQDTGADWRNDLNLFFSTLQNTVAALQQETAQEAKNLLEERVHTLDLKLCKPEHYSLLLGDINDVFTTGLLTIRDTISQEVEQKTASLQEQMALTLDGYDDILKSLNFAPDNNTEITFPKKTLSNSLVGKGRNISMNVMGAGMIGSILGGVIGFCFGGPPGMITGAAIGEGAGALLGGTKGCVEAFAKHDQMDLNVVNKYIANHIANSSATISRNINTALTEIRMTTISSYEKQLKKQVKTRQEDIVQLKKNLSLAQHELPTRQAELKKQAAAIKQMMQLLDDMLRALLGDGAVAEEPKQQEPEAPVSEKKEADKEEVTYDFL